MLSKMVLESSSAFLMEADFFSKFMGSESISRLPDPDDFSTPATAEPRASSTAAAWAWMAW